MGQNQSYATTQGSNLPSKSLESSELQHSDPKSKGITVVHTKPEATGTLAPGGATELQRLNNLHKFWPILRSTLEYEHPLETFEAGVKHELLLSLCVRYQQHLTVCASTVANEQRSLTSRMKDLEMFSAGIAQQLVKHQDRINRALPHLQRVTEMSKTLAKIQQHLNDCIPLVNRINMSLPENERLEYFSMNSNVTRRHPSSPMRGTGTPSVQTEEQTLEDSSEEEADLDDEP